jgi:hypothetical protein
MTAWERREGLKRVFVDGGSCFDPISGSTAAQDTNRSFNKRIQSLGPRHFETQANMALNSVHVPRPAASSWTSLR